MEDFTITLDFEGVKALLASIEATPASQFKTWPQGQVESLLHAKGQLTAICRNECAFRGEYAQTRG